MLLASVEADIVVLSADKNSLILAITSTKRGLLLIKGQIGTITYARKHCIVIGRNMQPHRHEEFTRFLNTI